MPSDMPVFAVRYVGEILTYVLKLLNQRIHALIHRHTYRSLPNPKHIVVIGGSFSGLYLAFRLSESVPSGYRVILIEQNSHFNYTFNFPRYSVMKGREQNAFVPYEGLFGKMPEGVFLQVRGRAVDIRFRDGDGNGSGEVVLEGGEKVEFEYLAIATGVTQSPPAKLLSIEKEGACEELRVLQERIREAEGIAVVGAGAVGVQLAADVKTFWPEKRVTVVHSRERILSSFGERLHEFVMGKLKDIGLEVVLGERPVLEKSGNWEPMELEFKDGSKKEFNLVVSLLSILL